MRRVFRKRFSCRCCATCTFFILESGDTSLLPCLNWRGLPWGMRMRRYEQTLLPGARFERGSRADRRVQTLPPENLAGDHEKHQGSGNREPGDLSAWNTDVHDHGSE